MKVYCFFTAYYLPHLGGVERYTYNLAKRLVLDGNKVIVVTSEIEGESGHTIVEGIEIIRVKSFSLINDRLPIMKICKHNIRIMKYLKTQEINYIIINTKLYPLSYIGAHFARKHQISSIVIEHGTGHISFENKMIQKLGEMYEHVMVQLVFHNCKYFVGVSKECNNWLTHFGIQAIGVLYNAVDYEHIQTINARDQKDNQEGYSIIYTGRMLAEKGVEKLVQAFIDLEKERKDICLYIVGDGPLYNEMIEKYKSNSKIIFTGKVTFETVISLLKQCDVYCFPTDYPEGMPTCVLEAMACGVYTITSGAGGSKEVICNEVNGVILKENDVEDIKYEIQNALCNSQYRCEVAQRGKESIRQHFDWSNTIDALYSIMGEITDEN